MKVAIVGAGFSGLAVAWHLLSQSKQLKIDLFDEREIGEGTSGCSSGLLDPYPGKGGNKSFDAEIAMKYAKELIEQAQKYTNDPIIQSKGIFKPALSIEQRHEYYSRLSENNELKWLTLFDYEGLFIPDAIAIHPRCYLKALFKGCLENGMQFFRKKVQLSDLSSYDAIVYAGGYQLDFLHPVAHFPLMATKGQMLVCEKVDLNTTICGHGHVSCIGNATYLGSTYERKFTDEKTDLTKAKQLKDQIGAFFPTVKNLKILQCRSGIRVKRKNHYLPLMGNVDHLWFITAMGSRGILYHSYLGRKLSHAILYKEKIDSHYMGQP